MAITKTTIVNKALTKVGAQPVVSIDDDTEQARAISRVYELALRSILSECKWNFATRRKLLSASATEFEWYENSEKYVYSKPADCIRVISTNDKYATWREEGDYILSDTANLGIRYVTYLDDPAKYSHAFIDAFVDKLCSDIAYSIVNSSSLGDTFFEKYEKLSLPKAMAINGQIGKQIEIVDDEWENAKYNSNLG